MKAADAHCHLWSDRFSGDLKEVITRTEEELEFAAVAGCDPETNYRTADICGRRDSLVPNLGLHPTFTDSFDSVEEVERQLREEDPPAVGEIGLDHHHVESESVRSRQREVFSRMLEIAEELGKPVVVHSREAEEETVEMLERSSVTALIHCFNGSLELASRAAGNGHLVGVTTQVLYSSQVQELARELPLESICLETDSPYLHPEGRNEPANVKEAARKVAELRDAETEEVGRVTTSNSSQLFGR